MASLSDLAYTNNMAAAKQPLLTDLTATLDSIQTYVNDTLKDNLIQLSKDTWGTQYSFDSDGSGQYTSNLYDKTTAVDSYTGGNFTISTTGAWTDVDATNVSVAITPEVSGDFRAVFSFVFSTLSTNATNECDIRFRLTDGTTASTQTPRVRFVTGVSGTRFVVPITLTYTYDAWSAAAKTVKLQYYITTTTAMTLIVMANSDDPILMEVEKV